MNAVSAISVNSIIPICELLEKLFWIHLLLVVVYRTQNLQLNAFV